MAIFATGRWRPNHVQGKEKRVVLRELMHYLNWAAISAGTGGGFLMHPTSALREASARLAGTCDKLAPAPQRRPRVEGSPGKGSAQGRWGMTPAGSDRRTCL